MRHVLPISRLRTGGLRIKTMRALMAFLIEPVMDRLLPLAGGLHGNGVPHFPQCFLVRVRMRDRGQLPLAWVGKDQQK